MKTFRRIFLAACGLVLATGSAGAVDASDLFLRAYQDFQAGEKFERDGNPREALARYRNAAKVLDQITKSDASWQPAVVEYRLRKSRENIERLAAQAAAFQESPEGPLPQADPGAINIPPPDVNTSRPLIPVRPSASRPSPAENPAYQPRAISPGESDSLRQQLAAARKESERWQEKFTRQSAELKSALFEVDRTKVTVVELKAKVAQTQDAFENAAKDREIARAKTPPPDDKRANELAARIEKIEADNEVLLDENSRLVAKLESASKYISSADDGRKTLDADRRKILRQRDEAIARTKRLKENAATIERLDTEKADLEKKFAVEKRALESKLAEAANPERLRKLERENKALSVRLDDSAKKFAEAEKTRASETALRITKIEADSEALQDENSRLLAKLESASKYIAAANAERGEIEADRKKIAAQRDAMAAKNTGLDAANEALLDENRRLFGKLESASKYIDGSEAVRKLLEADRKKIAAQRDAMAAKNTGLDVRNEVLLEENNRLFVKLEAAAKYIDGAVAARKLLEADRRVLVGRRDDALAAAKKLREEKAALEQVVGEKTAQEKKFVKEKKDLESKLAALPGADRLRKVEAENKKLAAEIEEAGRKLAEAAKKPDDKTVSDLRSEMNGLNDRLLEAQSQIAGREEQIKKLAAQLDEASGEIARLKLNPEPTAEEKRAISENDVLRGIILRQIKEQSGRDAARTALENEIQSLQIKSDTISKQLGVLARPAFQLTEQEALIFKEPVTLLSETGNSSLNVTMAISKPGAKAGTPPDAKQESKPTATGPDALSKDSRDLVEQARQLFNDRQFADAEKIYQKIVESAPDNYFVLTNLGVTQIQAKKLAAAEVALKKAVSINPKDSFAITNLGIVYCKRGHFDEAIATLKEALSLDGKNHVALNYLGICYGEKGLTSEAEDCFKRSIEIRNDYPDAHFNLAVLYVNFKPPAVIPGREHYNKAIQFGSTPDPALDRLLK